MFALAKNEFINTSISHKICTNTYPVVRGRLMISLII